MAVDTVAGFVAEVRQGQLLEPAQLDELTKDAKSFTDPRVLAKHCLKKNWLTPFQINQLLHGAGGTLVMGQYRLLERLGEGGMGQVFKARHQAMGRIVALKVIRKDRLENEKAVKRFRREIQVAAQLTHPNVVLAFDADAVNGQHFIAMEYVDGVDLTRMVKEKGPLPVATACDFIRQAALGLQHAHERGLVHRDIKPSNLLVTRPNPNGERPASNSGVLRKSNKPQIKILDMGLARLMFDSDEAGTGMTQDGLVVGTPDFMSPEQGKNSHLVDHRADIYSLGCTFYFLLGGQVPFPGGSNIEKLLKHQMDHPKPIEQLRADTPDGVRNLVRRMMAKKPDDRPQTGSDVASLVAPFCDPSAIKPGPGRDSKKMQLPVAEMIAPTPSRRTAWSRVKSTADSSISVFRGLFAPRQTPRPRGRGKLVLAALALLLLLGGFLFLKSMFSSSDPASTGGKTPTGLASTRLTPAPTGTTTPTTPTPTQPTPKIIEPKQAANAPSRFFPEATSLAIGFQVREIINSRVSGFVQQRDARWRLLLDQAAGIDLNVEVEQVVVCIVAADGGAAQQQAMVFHGPFENKRFQSAVLQRGGKPQANYYVYPDDRSCVAMLTPSVVVWTPHESLMRNIVDRNTGPVPPPLADAAIQKRFESWDNWPPVRVVAGGNWPTGRQNPDKLAAAGLREVLLDITLTGEGASARLQAATDTAAHATLFQKELPDLLAELANRDNPYAMLLKHLLETQSTVTAEHVVIWQEAMNAKDISSYFYRKKP